MEAKPPADLFVHSLAACHRVVMLGGMAMIAHGLDRKTKDVDVWLEPLETCVQWAKAVIETANAFPTSRFWSLAEKRILRPEEIAAEVGQHGVLRVSGFDRDIDVFRDPNELDIASFDRVWRDAARELEGRVRLPNEIDLYQSKANTGRDHDWQDQLFLETKVKARFRDRLPVCDLPEATDMLERYLSPEVLVHAKGNPSAEVRELALKYLREFEAEGDPYSRDILAAWNEK
jgi:hypothetical protein